MAETRSRAGLKKIFLVHGELPAQQTLAREIQQPYNIPVVIPHAEIASFCERVLPTA